MTFSLGYRELLRQQKVAHHLTALLRFFLIKIIGTCDEKLQKQYREVQNEEQKASTCTLPKEHVPIPRQDFHAYIKPTGFYIRILLNFY